MPDLTPSDPTPADPMPDSADAEASVRRYLQFLDDPSLLVDKARVDALREDVAAATDPIAKLKLLAELDRAEQADGERLKLGFVTHAKGWADANDVPAAAFRQLGVPDDVLEAAGFGGRGRARRPVVTKVAARARPIGREAIQAHVTTRTEPFTLAEVVAATGASPMTARNAVEDLVESARLRKLGPDPARATRGRAPVVYAPA